MQSQRGSVTVIAIAMLLFLMLIAVAWLPMMTMEKTAASSDYREQQAWYAAEAGYKRAVAQLAAGNTTWKDWLIDDNNLKDGTFSVINGLGGEQQSGNEKLAGVLKNGIWYAVAIFDTSGMDLKHGERDDDGNYTPVQGETYSITSIGSCDGIRKVIRKKYTLGDNGGTGGGDEPDEPEPPQDNVYLGDALVAAGGAVSIYFVNGDNSGKIYGGSIAADGFNKVGLVPNNSVKYYVQDKVFESSYYKNIQNNADQDLKDGSIITKGAYYYGSAEIKGGKVSVSGNSVLLTSGDIKLSNMSINVDSGVLQIVANGNVEINNVEVTGAGQLTVISKGELTINNLSGNSKTLLIGNNVEFYNPNVSSCFISSKNTIKMKVWGNDKFEYRGQMQAAGSVSIYGNQLQQNNFKLHFEKIAGELNFPPMQ